MRVSPGILLFFFVALFAADHRPPAGTRPAAKKPGGETILPGGRMLAPLGRQYAAGTGPWGLAVAPNGKRVVTVDAGEGSYSLTHLEGRSDGWRIARLGPEEHQRDAVRGTFLGVAFEGNDEIYASEGNTGRVRVVSLLTGNQRQTYELNGGPFTGSFAGDLILDGKKRILYVTDRANARVVAIDTRRNRIAGQVRTGRMPFSLALSANGSRLYVTCVGLFDYGAGAFKETKETSTSSVRFSLRERDLPGLHEANVREANALAVVDVSNPSSPEVVKQIPVGMPFRSGERGGTIPIAVAANETHIFVSNAGNDSVTVVNAKTLEVEEQIAIRIPGMEHLRGILPAGLALDGAMLYAAEAGINAVAAIDLKTKKVTAHFPAGWFPTRVAVREGMIYVANAKGHGVGPTASLTRPYEASAITDQRRGTVSIYAIPDPADYQRHTARVMQLNGLSRGSEASKLPAEIKHVVVIVKEKRTFDEIFGDVVSAENAPVNGAWDLARYGQYAEVASERGTLAQRFSMKNVPVTPNHHALAERFAIGDNFYADSDLSVDGHHWLAEGQRELWTEASLRAAYGSGDVRIPPAAPGRALLAQPSIDGNLEPGALWRHMDRHGITYRRYGDRLEAQDFLSIPDQTRASAFIADMEKRHIVGNESLPRFLYIHLPNDHAARPRPEDGYPFPSSFVADNDYALGRIIEFLSNSPWWKQMAVFVTEGDASGGVDHVDAHRTVFIAASPWVRRNYVSKTNTGFPGMLKTTFRLLGVPSMNLYDAIAADVADCFADSGIPDAAPFAARPIRPELFDPAKAREAR